MIKSSNILNTWSTYNNRILTFAVFIMAVFAILKLGNEFYRLIWETGPLGAIDLNLRYKEVHYWFIGKPVYKEFPHAAYPPASYAILWPFLGWLSLAHARWLWAVTSVVTLAWFLFLIVKESGAKQPLEQVFVGLMLVSMNAAGVAIGNGQIILQYLPMLLTGLLILQKSKGKWTEDIVSSSLIGLSLVKPNVSVPFLWLALFIPKRIRPITLVMFWYLLLTLISSLFQESTLFMLLNDWQENASLLLGKGYANVSSWLETMGLGNWSLLASSIILLGLGIWTYHCRTVDFWILLGVTAIVARFWTFHHLYDNVLIILPMVTLFRLAKSSPATASIKYLSGVLLAVSIFANIIPARVHYFWPNPWPTLLSGFHTILWLMIMIFLLAIASIRNKQRIV